jgi:hypothetical protein
VTGILAGVVIWCLIWGGLFLLDVIGERRVRRLNEQAQRDYQAARLHAKATGLPPPPPPNVWVRR